MTYQEALTLKSKFGDYIQSGTDTYSILIVPSKTDELISFFSDYDKQPHQYTDTLCQKYSTDGDYAVYTYLDR